MEKMKSLLNWCISLVLITVLLVVPAIAETRHTIKIWPDQLKPMTPTVPYYQDVSQARNNIFYSPISPPLGVKIVKITYYHLGGAPSPSTTLRFIRIQMGKEPEVLGSESSTDATGVVIPVDVLITGDPIIKAGYRYYIQIESVNANSIFTGAKITYQE